jgi:rhodanese-related sulfurtransferase/thiol-disulfide isomerase/thioredoxin
MPVPVVSEQDFEQNVLMNELPVVVEFFSPTSNMSKAAAPEVEAAAKDLEGKAVFVKVDVERSRRIVAALRVQGIPSFAVFVKGRPVALKSDVLRRKAIVDMVEPFLPRAEGAITPPELAEALRQKLVVAVDIREASSFGRAHIPSAVSFPLEDVRNRLAELHMLQAQLIFYCRTGKDSKELAFELAEQMPEVGYLEGGFLAWEAEQLPIERPD